MLYLPITRGWIISRTARRLYFLCALAAFALFGIGITTVAALSAAGTQTLEPFPAAAWMVRILIFPGILGAALLSIAMWYFWFEFDHSAWLRKAIWLVLLAMFLPVGPAFYYFLVYRRAPEVAKRV